MLRYYTDEANISAYTDSQSTHVDSNDFLNIKVTIATDLTEHGDSLCPLYSHEQLGTILCSL